MTRRMEEAEAPANARRMQSAEAQTAAHAAVPSSAQLSVMERQIASEIRRSEAPLAAMAPRHSDAKLLFVSPLAWAIKKAWK